ncbi:MAG: lysophospholipase [Tumebacillaceae bacterium]
MVMNVHTETYPAAASRMGGAPAAVVLVHGAGEHCGRYSHVVEKLTSHGIAVVTGDLPGHGRTEGLRGHVDSFDDYLDAVEGWVRQAEELAERSGELPGDMGQDASNAPIAILGHSMGGLVVIRYLQERAAAHPRIASAVVSSPCLRLSKEVPGWQRSLAGVLDGLTPRLRMASNIAPSDVSRSPEVIRSYGTDPLNGNKVSVRWFRELNRAMESACANPQRITVPMLVMQAGQDKLVAPQETESFYKKLPVHERHKFVPYPELYHELFNEPEREVVFAEMMNWLLA